ncbi:hypothetical protein ACI3PL_28335, partial [Lacticaseibacillus paracasei]
RLYTQNSNLEKSPRVKINLSSIVSSINKTPIKSEKEVSNYQLSTIKAIKNSPIATASQFLRNSPITKKIEQLKNSLTTTST